ncbi:hypothetical protein Vadar_019644 [Vaccinium darrowii]|uniref:Uncharacterized protein n=1 Tax=Vaccinium darrowii TaxID=229202 RepID=A0ACB7XIJ9_9ERIC|nr:hypothetical protein Vadar_019644 [Vaccinium darrowii]
MSSQTPSQSKKQSRRLWTAKEEEALLSAMMDCISDKFRADNGFKSGFFVAVEKELQKLLPGTTLKANPNIESKVKNWKEKYGVIADAIRISGFQWNFVTQSIEVDDESIWEEYEKDRATGEIAEDPQEIPDEDDHVETHNLIDIETGYIPRYENGEPSFIPSQCFVDLSCGSETANPNIPNPTTPTSATPTSNAGLKPPKKKAKPSKEGALHEAMGSYMAKSNEVLEKIASGICHDKELSVLRSGVMDELLKLNLEMDDMFVANERICETEQRVETFYALPDHLKYPWVIRVLEGKLYATTRPSNI